VAVGWAGPEGPSSVSDLLLLATVFGVTFVAELPDKSLFASLVLGTRYRPVHVWLGVAAAFAVHVGLAVTVGGLQPGAGGPRPDLSRPGGPGERDGRRLRYVGQMDATVPDGR
jgi:hypothetical protein